MKKVLLSVMVIFLSTMSHLFGQPTVFEIIGPTASNPEHQIFPLNGAIPRHVANASLQLSSAWGQNILNAVVYNDDQGDMFLEVLVLDDNSNLISSNSVQLPINGYFPDVIIRDDINNPGQEWIVSIVLNAHSCPGSTIYLVEYKIDDPYGVNANLMNMVAVGDGIYPKIDGFIDPFMMVDNELFAMTDFAVVFNNLDPSNNLMLMHYDFNSNLVNLDVINGFMGFAPDVACVTNVVMGGAKFLYITDYAPGGNLNLFLYDMNSMALVSHDVSSYPTYLPYYRIDAHSLIDDFLNQNRYIISGTHDCHDHYFLVDNFVADFNNPASYMTVLPNLPTTTGWRLNGAHTVAAGMGYDLPSGMPPGFPFTPLGSRINREEFTSLHSYISNSNDVDLMLTNYQRPTGYNTPLPDMFQVNNNPYNYGSLMPSASREICTTCTVFADGGSGASVVCGHTDYSYFFNTSVATQPNLGDYTVACWIDESNGIVNLKQTHSYGNMGGSIISHQADVMPEAAGGAVTPVVFPNPAKDIIHITSGGRIASIEVFNILGQRIQQYRDLNSHTQEIHVADLGTGSPAVLLHVMVDGKKYVTKVLLDKE